METAPGPAPPPRPRANGRAAEIPGRGAVANEEPGSPRGSKVKAAPPDRGAEAANEEAGTPSRAANERPGTRGGSRTANERAGSRGKPLAANAGSALTNEEPGGHEAANRTSASPNGGSAAANEEPEIQEASAAAILGSTEVNGGAVAANEEPGARGKPMAAILDPTPANEEPEEREKPAVAILDPTPANEEPESEEMPLAAMLAPRAANEDAEEHEKPIAAILDTPPANEEPEEHEKGVAAILAPTPANEDPESNEMPPAAILAPTPANEDAEEPEKPMTAILAPRAANEEPESNEMPLAAILAPTPANEEPESQRNSTAAILATTPANEDAEEPEKPMTAILAPTPANEDAEEHNKPMTAILAPRAANEEPESQRNSMAAIWATTPANQEPVSHKTPLSAILSPTPANEDGDSQAPPPSAILPPSPSPSAATLGAWDAQSATSLPFGLPDGDGSSIGSDSEAAAPASRRPDRHGFLGGQQFSRGPGRPVPVSLSHQRELKWLQMLQHWDWWLGQRYHKVKLRCRKGVPPSLRARAWQFLSRSQSELDAHPGLFQELIGRPGDPRWVDAIERDLHRQFPLHEMFVAQGGAGQQDLFRVLKAYSVYRPLEGYCQAQAPVAAVLLMHMPAEQAFWCLVQICDKYLPGYYSAGLEALQLDGRVFEALLRRVLPGAQRHLRRQRVEPPLYLTEWFTCLFARSLPWAAVLRVWDMFFCEGLPTLFRVALVLLRRALGTPQKLRSCPGFCETMESIRSAPWGGGGDREEEGLLREVAQLIDGRPEPVIDNRHGLIDSCPS